MLILTVALLCLAAIGHAAFWIGLVNRWHATGFPRAMVKSVTVLFYAGFTFIPLAIGWLWLRDDASPADESLDALSKAYVAFCACCGAVTIPIWAMRTSRAGRLPEGVRWQDNEVVDIAQRLGASPARGPRAAFFSLVPGNELCQLHVTRFAIDVPGLAAEHDGLTVCHLSDLHFSGRLDRGYFHEVVRLTNQIRPDLIALTGDVCDKARLIDWVGETLGPAEARLGKYFILGNHDLRTHDVRRLRAAMRDAGFVDVAGRCEILRPQGILLAGDERPWIDAQGDMSGVAPEERRALACKMLLAHTPDRFGFAQAQGFDLMLAGHTHGGQIRFPLVGPVICPSWYGTKYAAGFYRQGPTLMHVSRGTASLFPLRIGCPPEITQLVLRASKKRSGAK